MKKTLNEKCIPILLVGSAKDPKYIMPVTVC